ncbi:hypothetical protein D3C76_1402390 [compost metagenome]
MILIYISPSLRKTLSIVAKPQWGYVSSRISYNRLLRLPQAFYTTSSRKSQTENEISSMCLINSPLTPSESHVLGIGMQGNADILGQLLSLFAGDVIRYCHFHVLCFLRFWYVYIRSEGTE